MDSRKWRWSRDRDDAAVQYNVIVTSIKQAFMMKYEQRYHHRRQIRACARRPSFGSLRMHLGCGEWCLCRARLPLAGGDRLLFARDRRASATLELK
jgi:hypothetical protein